MPCTVKAVMLGFAVIAGAVIAVTAVIVVELLSREPDHEPPDTALRSLRGQYEAVADGLRFVSSLASDGESRIYISEFRTGAIRVFRIDTPGQPEPTDFAMVPLPKGMGTEQGLWTLAVHPDGKFLYASAVAATGDDSSARIVRFPIRDDGRAGPMEVICEGLPSERVHNGGALAFGPDGLLYATVGDTAKPSKAGDVRDFFGRSATIDGFSELAGVIYRIDPNGCPSPPLSVDDLVVAHGFRNPYGMAFAADGTLYVTDNGPNCCDRVYRVERGRDHGWPRYGIDEDELDEFRRDPSVVAPLTHSGKHQIAATQLVYFDGDAYDGDLRHSLIYGTYHAASLLRVDLSPDGRAAVMEEVLLTLPARGDGDIPESIVGVTLGPDGYVYFATLGTVFRLDGVSPLPAQPATQR